MPRPVRVPSTGLAAALALVVALGGGAGGCGSSSSSGSGPVARFDLSSNPVPRLLDVPFPSDVYLAQGKVGDVPGADAFAPQNSQFITHELSKMDGFSRTALALFYVDDPAQPPGDDGRPGPAAIDPATLPGDEAACGKIGRASCRERV